MIKNLSLYFVFAVLSISIPSTFAWGGYSWPEFIPVDGKMCAYKDQENVKLIYTEEDCLEWSDPATFQKFRKGRLLFGKYGGNIYVDKNAIYYFPMNGEWTRTELNVKGLRKLKDGYLTDGNSYFYNSIRYRPINLFWQVKNDKIIYLGEWLISYSGGVYYNGILEEWLIPAIIEKKNGNLFSRNILLLPDGWTLHRIDNVDIATLKQNRNNYEDKDNYYNLISGHYGFDVETNPKVILYKNTEYGFQFSYPWNWKVETVTIFDNSAYTPKLRLHLSNMYDFSVRKFDVIIDVVSKEEYAIPAWMVFDEQWLEIPQAGSNMPTYIKIVAESPIGGDLLKWKEKQIEKDTTLFENQWKKIIGSFQSLR